jgi:hypothetical protein
MPPTGLVGGYQSFGGTGTFFFSAEVKMEAENYSETLVTTHETTWWQ